MYESNFIHSTKFVPYGVEYFTTILVITLMGVLLIRYGRGKDKETQWRVLRILSYVISFAVIMNGIIEIMLGRFDLSEDLPLIFCNLIALFLPIYTYYRKQFLFDVLYYIILAGAIQSVSTPSIELSLPFYDTIKFWIVHGGLIIFILFIIFLIKTWPTFKGIMHAFLFVQVYVVLIIGINYLLGANYLFLNEKPQTASILDLLGDWPYYILIMDVLLIPYFGILYLPIWIIRKKWGN